MKIQFIKPFKTVILVAALAASTQVFAGVALEKATLAGNETIDTPYGSIILTHNFVSDGEQTLFDAMDFQRASQAYIWSTPIVSLKHWQNSQAETFGAKNLGDFVVYRSMKEKGGLITANMTTPYVITFLSLADGPVTVNIPAGKLAGVVLDLWQRPVVDLGLTGPDRGKGGTYIIVGPEDDISKYQGKADFVVQSATNNTFVGVRLIDSSAKFNKYVKDTMTISRLGQAQNPVKFIVNVDKEWSATAPRGLAYWEILSQIYQEEPTREQDKIFAAMLEPLGIAKGKAFDPTSRQVKILEQGAAMGELMLRNLQTTPRFSEAYWEDTSWYKSFDFTVPQITDEKVELDERAVWFYEAVTSSEGMVNPTPGRGQVYMTTKSDSNGQRLRADKTYKLHVPADVPVTQFWSLALYSEDTRRPYDNGGTQIADVNLSSRMDQLQYNSDGSIDLYVGNKAPLGMESNFVKTMGTDGWFVYFRLYGPTKAFFDKSFKMGDFEMISK